MRNEIRYAIRGLLRDRVFALMIVLSLAVGIGANTAIFSLVNGVLLQPPDFPHPERLVALTQWAPKLLKSYPALPVNIAIYAEWRKQMTSFESIGIAQASVFNLTGSGQPEQVRGAMVSSTIFPVLGVQPKLGRGFTDQEDQIGTRPGRHPRRFALAPPLPGRPVHRRPQNPARWQTATKWSASCPPPSTSLAKRNSARAPSAKVSRSTNRSATIPAISSCAWAISTTGPPPACGPAVSAARAQAELNVVQAAISKQIPGDLDLHATLIPLQERMVGDVRQGLVLLMAAVGAVLLVLCVNLANLSLARAAGRARDAAIRTALGASRRRLLTQSIAESTLLSLTGGALGVVLAYWGLRALLAAAPIDLPRLQEVHVDCAGAALRPRHFAAHRPDLWRPSRSAERAVRPYGDPEIGRAAAIPKAAADCACATSWSASKWVSAPRCWSPPDCSSPASSVSWPSTKAFRWIASSP